MVGPDNQAASREPRRCFDGHTGAEADLENPICLAHLQELDGSTLGSRYECGSP